MGISLNGLTPANTYPGLIKTGDNTAISGTPKVLSDGNGNNLPMEVSTTGVNFTNQLQQGGVAVPTASQVAAKQDTLVSGTNIKTINSTSILGSGNINVVTSPSGIAGAIQFSNGSAFASDAANLFWDDTNNRLGVGTNAPIELLSVQKETVGFDMATFIGHKGVTNYNGLRIGTTTNAVGYIQGISGSSMSANYDFYLQPFGGGVFIGSSSGSPSAKLHIKGSGSTSATTSLLVQNSAGSSALTVKDDLSATFGGLITTGNAVVTGAMRITNINTQSDSYTAIYLNNADGCAAFPRTVFIGAGAASTDASAILEAKSTTKGVLFPRMTTTQKNAISSPAAGLVVYDSTTNKLCCYNGSTWNDLF